VYCLLAGRECTQLAADERSPTGLNASVQTKAPPVFFPLPLETFPADEQDPGWNAIHFNQVVNGWVRNVQIVNADCGFYSWGSVFTTVDGLSLYTTKSRGEYAGHRGVWMERGSDNMIKK
jgi:hypothetical protein